MSKSKFTVLVADRGQALLYETEKLGRRLQRVSTLTNPSARGHERDLGASAPGRSFNRSAGVHQTLSQRTSLQDQATERFARSIGRSLSQLGRSADCTGIVLVASPRLLSRIRKTLPRAVQAKVVAEVPKDLVHQPQRLVVEHLQTLH